MWGVNHTNSMIVGCFDNWLGGQFAGEGIFACPAGRELNMETAQQTTNVLLAFDGSEHAQAAIKMLSDMPLARCDSPQLTTQVTVLAVMPTQYITGHEQLQATLNAAVAALSNMKLRAAGILKAGNPPASIVALAQEMKAELIVIGARGLRATLGILLGGVAQQVVEYATRPVLVVRAPYKGLHRVLLITDGSPYSQRAVKFIAPGPTNPVCSLLPGDAEVHVMHVMPPSIPPDLALRAWTIGPEVIYPVPIQPIDITAQEADEERQGQAVVDEALQALQIEGIRAKAVLKRGDAATEIMEYIHNNHIDLTVCGSRGYGQMAGWFMGSVSRKLLHYSDCSVLVVK